MEYRIVGGRSNRKTFTLCKQYFIATIQEKIKELQAIDNKLGNTYEFNGEIDGIKNWRKEKDKINNQIIILEEILLEWKKKDGQVL